MSESCHRVGVAAPRHRVYEEFATNGGLVEFWTAVDHPAARPMSLVAAERGATFPSLPRAQTMLDLGILFSTKCNVRIKPPFNGPVHLYWLRLGGNLGDRTALQ